MRLYSGTSQQFVKDSIQNFISDKLRSAFFTYYRYNPSPSEVNSWRNSLRAMAQVVQYANLTDNGVILEYQLPQSSKRLDCMLTGKDETGADNAVIVELKQWESCEPSDSDNEVVTWVGGAKRDVLHPSAQVGQYRSYLADTHTAFYDDPDPISLNACAYLHNYHFRQDDELFSAKFHQHLEDNPVFAADQVDNLSTYLSSAVAAGDGWPILQRVEQSKYRPSKKLMDHVAKVIQENSDYVLLDEQLVVFDKVLSAVRSGCSEGRKRILIINGGPGTGKSVIALNLMAELLRGGHNAHYATGSRAFTETLRRIIGTRGSVQFKYFNSYVDAEPDEVDVLICDEAHRVRKTSNNRFTKASKRSRIPQIKELINTSRVGVFFIDDNQIVRPDEIGSSTYIREHAEKLACDVEEFELEAQFRCNGSDAFVNWVNNTLGIRQTANILWSGDENFDFQIFGSATELEAAIIGKSRSASARLTAGFCWPWSKPNPDGTLVSDVRIGTFARPWNAKSGAGRLAKGIPKESLWAYDPNGIHQVGCIYTAQGFEFDYVGVIWGPDLKYDFDVSDWRGDKRASYDTVVKRSKEQFIDLVKNTYRVLLTRGLKGCYVCFLDKDTERFVKTRMEHTTPIGSGYPKVAEEPRSYDN